MHRIRRTRYVIRSCACMQATQSRSQRAHWRLEAPGPMVATCGPHAAQAARSEHSLASMRQHVWLHGTMSVPCMQAIQVAAAGASDWYMCVHICSPCMAGKKTDPKSNSAVTSELDWFNIGHSTPTHRPRGDRLTWRKYTHRHAPSVISLSCACSSPCICARAMGHTSAHSPHLQACC